MQESSLIRSGLRKGNRVRSSHGSGLVRSDTLAEKLISIFAPACARSPSVTAVRDPTTHASCCRSQKCSKSVTASLAAEKASLALTCDFGAVCEPPVGSKIRATASQNVIRRKNHIARPCFLANQQPSSLRTQERLNREAVVANFRSVRSPWQSRVGDQPAKPIRWGRIAIGV